MTFSNGIKNTKCSIERSFRLANDLKVTSSEQACSLIAVTLDLTSRAHTNALLAAFIAHTHPGHFVRTALQPLSHDQVELTPRKYREPFLCIHFSSTANLKPFARNAITIPQSNVTSRKGDTSLSFLTSNLVLSPTIWPICSRTRSQRQTKYINGQRALPAVFDHPWCRSTFRPISVQRILRKSKLFQYSFIYSATKV